MNQGRLTILLLAAVCLGCQTISTVPRAHEQAQRHAPADSITAQLLDLEIERELAQRRFIQQHETATTLHAQPSAPQSSPTLSDDVNFAAHHHVPQQRPFAAGQPTYPAPAPPQSDPAANSDGLESTTRAQALQVARLLTQLVGEDNPQARAATLARNARRPAGTAPVAAQATVRPPDAQSAKSSAAPAGDVELRTLLQELAVLSERVEAAVAATVAAGPPSSNSVPAVHGANLTRTSATFPLTLDPSATPLAATPNQTLSRLPPVEPAPERVQSAVLETPSNRGS